MGRNYTRYTTEEKMELITRCRQSGLSDYEWCRENNINSSTFYYWIKKLHTEACELETAPAVKTVQKQEIVKVDIFQDNAPLVHRSTDTSTTSDTEVALELMINDSVIKIHNNVNPTLLAQTIRIIRGLSC